MSKKTLSNRTYTALSNIADIFLPALGVICFFLSLIFSIGGIRYILGTILIFILVLGIILLVSSNNYKETHSGEIIIRENELGTKVFSLELDADPNELEAMDVISFKVISETEPNVAE